MANKLAVYKITLILAGLLLLACEGGNAPLEKIVESATNTEITQIKPANLTYSILSGTVDSSLIDRNAQNKVYVYSEKSNNPIVIASVVQIPGTCRWRYEIEQLPTGDYTLALARDPQRFIQKQAIQIQDRPQLKNFTAAHVVKVGPARVIRTPSEAAQYAKPGDVIEIDAGDYTDDIAVWRQNNVVIRGVVGDEKNRPHMRMSKPISFVKGNDQANGMGIWVLKADNIRIENIEFSGAKVPHKNGAGVRIDNALNSTICNSVFHHNENGLLGGGGILLVEYSEFRHNGSGTGYTHNIYVNQPETTLIFQYNYSHHARVGHNLKTRAKINHILYNRIMDEKEGRSSYLVDVSNGGLTYMIGNILQQGRHTINKTTAIAYGLEGITKGYSSKLFFVNNTLVNNLGSGYYLNLSPNTQASFFNNLFLAGGTMVNTAVVRSNNLESGLEEVVDASGFNYHLTPTSKARNAGLIVDNVNGFDLIPKYEYVNPTSRKTRIGYGASIDIGAYEYYPGL